MSEISTVQLGRSVARLDEALTAHNADRQNDMIRDAVIQRFEFTFELAQSMLRKFVVAMSVNQKEREQLTFPTMIRTASQDGVLLNGYDVWKGYREARNTTSHTCDEDKAVAVMKVVPRFLEDVKFLYQRLTEELGDA
jgi:nucleotidyltransferase substrate binding protein (TIGR01987 family)